MTYLLSQIFISLLLAAVAGAAIGWILHGYKANQREQGLRTALERQAAATAHAQQERQMIADDYDDMKLGLESRLGEVQYENRQIPVLQENLEKSQQLVQQMMEKHKAEIDELATSNNDLHGQMDTLKAKLSNAANNDISHDTSNDKASTKQPAHSQSKQGTQTEDTQSDRDADVDHSDATVKLRSDEDEIATEIDTDVEYEDADDVVTEGKRFVDASQTEVKQSPDSSPETVATADERSGTTAALSSMAGAPDLNALTVETHVQNELFELENEIEDMRLEEKNIHLETLNSRTTSDDELPASTSTESQNTSGENGIDAKPGTAKIFKNSNGDRDDLQNIHGIGPVIEQSLNDIGIINYQQIATLTRKEIEEIADILNIFPGRIERDNWIGNARKLLSDPNKSINNSADTKEKQSKEDAETPENA